MVDDPGFEVPFTECPEVRQVRAAARKLATGHMPVLFVGEPGTGRKTLAEAVIAAQDFSGAPTFEVPGGAGLDPTLRDMARGHFESPLPVIVREIDLLR